MPGLDYLDDVNHQQFYTLDKLYGIPEFVKNAQVDDTKTRDTLPSTVFADHVHRKFPCHTKVATWLAQAYFSLNNAAYSTKDAAIIQDRIDKSAAYWGIQGLVNGFKKAWTKLASTEMPTVSDDDHALVVDYGGHKLRRMPMPNAISVKLAANYLYANRFKYPYIWRKTAARRIMRKMAHYDSLAAKGVKVAGAEAGATRLDKEVQDYLQRAAGLGANVPIKIAEKLAERVIMLPEKHDDIRLKLAEVAKNVDSMDEITLDELEKVAELVDAVDRETGLCNYYHRSVEMPEQFCFDVLEKEAAAIVEGHISLTTGNAYPVEIFKDLPLAKIAEVMGKEFADAVTDASGLGLDLSKLAEIAPTLPRPDAALLEKAIDASGQEKQARAARMAKADLSKEGLADFFKGQGHDVETRKRDQENNHALNFAL